MANMGNVHLFVFRDDVDLKYKLGFHLSLVNSEILEGRKELFLICSSELNSIYGSFHFLYVILRNENQSKQKKGPLLVGFLTMEILALII